MVLGSYIITFHICYETKSVFNIIEKQQGGCFQISHCLFWVLNWCGGFCPVAIPYHFC